MDERLLNPRQKLFVEAYAGDSCQAARIAGYTGTDSYVKQKGDQLLKLPHIIEAIRNRSKYLAETHKVIADRKEIQAFWTALLRNEDPHIKDELDEDGIPIKDKNIPLQHRIKASELFAKSEGYFIDNLNIQGQLTITDIISQAYQIDDSELDAIEAEYEEIREKRQIADEATAAPTSAHPPLDEAPESFAENISPEEFI